MLDGHGREVSLRRERSLNVAGQPGEDLPVPLVLGRVLTVRRSPSGVSQLARDLFNAAHPAPAETQSAGSFSS